jgi:hypothetical protein
VGAAPLDAAVVRLERLEVVVRVGREGRLANRFS